MELGEPVSPPDMGVSDSHSESTCPWHNKDEAKAMDYMKKFHANIATYPGTSPGAILSIANGEAVACPNWAHDILTQKAKTPGVNRA